MVNEKDYQEHEEGEYHFSDEQTSFETEHDLTETAGTQTTALPSSVSEKLAHYRQHIIAISFCVIALLSYKLLTAVFAAKHPVDSSNQTTVIADLPAQKAKPSSPVLPKSTSPISPVQSAITAPDLPASAVAVDTTSTLPDIHTTSSTPMNSGVPPLAHTPPDSLMQSDAQQATSPLVVLPNSNGVAVQQDALTTKMKDNALSAKQDTQAIQLINQQHKDYIQQLAEYQAQSLQVQNQLQSLTTRLVNVEKSLEQLVRVLSDRQPTQSSASPNQATPSGVDAVSTARPAAGSTDKSETQVDNIKLTYTVQAIIPGRTWLKADSGEIVTLAEGDVLKGYGRVTKIDPYDGIVSIDTGKRIISLSYGQADE